MGRLGSNQHWMRSCRSVPRDGKSALLRRGSREPAHAHVLPRSPSLSLNLFLHVHTTRRSCELTGRWQLSTSQEKRSQNETDIVSTSIWGFPASRIMRKTNASCLSPRSMVFCYGSLSRLIEHGDERLFLLYIPES